MEQELARASKRASETGDGEGAGQNSSLHAAGGQQEEESECSEEAKEANGGKEQEIEGLKAVVKGRWCFEQKINTHTYAITPYAATIRVACGFLELNGV